MSIWTNLRRPAQAGLSLAVAGSFALTGATALAQDADVDLSTLTGSIEIDGSSTVAPVTEAVAEEFGLAGANGVELSIGVSGTGGGFERFCNGETAISNASRPISDEEIARCAENGVAFYEMALGQDGVTVVVNPQDAFLSCISVSALAEVWAEDGTSKMWSDVNPEFPAETINLYGPGPDSGTFDFFNEEILGDDRVPTTDYTPSEDDNVLVEGITGDANAMGYFGFAYYEANADALAPVSLATQDDLSDCVAPSLDTIRDGSYLLSRPLYIYVKADSLQDPATQAFVRFYLENAEALVGEVGYVPMPAEDYTAAIEKLDGIVAGEVTPDSEAMATPAA